MPVNVLLGLLAIVLAFAALTVALAFELGAPVGVLALGAALAALAALALRARK
jgi:hypothetical protein